MDSRESEPTAFGVLFVDGFRQQRPGSAIALLASALYGWLFRWNTGARPAQAEPQLSGVVVSDGLSNEQGQPLHLTLSVPLQLASGEVACAPWLLAESSWASLFSPPQFLGLARWIWKVSTCLLVLQFVIPMRRHWNEASSGEGSSGWLADVFMAVCYLALMAVAAVLSVLVSLVLLVLAIASYLPIPRIDDAVRWVVVHVSAILGDSYMLAHCPVQFAAMRTQIARDLDWLQGRCGKVAVIAHSQGAAIVHHVLKERSCRSDRLTGLVTLGQGISKLDLMWHLDWDPDARAAAWQSRWSVTIGMASAGLPALGLVAGQWLGVTGLRGLSAVPVTAALLCGGFACLAFGVRRAMRAVCGALEDDLSLPAAGYLWSDYYASADPVSNGPLPRRAGHLAADTRSLLPKPCEEVFNSGSVFFDHNGYLHNQDELLPRLVNDLVRAAYSDNPAESGGYQLVADEDIAASRHRRRLWIRGLITARVAAAGLLATMMWWKDPSLVLKRPLDELIHLLSPHAQMGSGTVRLIASLIITAAFYGLAVTCWRIAIGRSVEHFFKTARRGAQPTLRNQELASAKALSDAPGAAL